MKKIGILLSIIVLVILPILWVNHFLVENTSSTKMVMLQVSPGTSSREIASRLHEKELITSPIFFKLILAVRGYDNKLKAGWYEFDDSYSTMEIIDKMVAGEVATFRVTIPEGYTVKDISHLLAEKTPHEQESFLEAARKMEYKADSEGNPVHDDIIYNIEGFLYPDTYIIPLEYSPEQIFRVMLNEFNRKWGIEKLNLSNNDISIWELITIASLIEKEARLSEEKSLVSGVIYNRMERNMLLQIDACIQYLLDERRERIYYSDLEIDSPYNTYMYGGLPPGPICSPGSESIKAALEPAEVDYLFYFALPDGSHKFTTNYQDHLYYQELTGEVYEE